MQETLSINPAETPPTDQVSPGYVDNFVLPPLPEDNFSKPFENAENLVKPDWLIAAGEVALSETVEPPVEVVESVPETAERSMFQKAKKFLGQLSLKKTVKLVGSSSYGVAPKYSQEVTFKYPAVPVTNTEQISSDIVSDVPKPTEAEWDDNPFMLYPKPDTSPSQSREDESAESTEPIAESPQRYGEFIKKAPKFAEQLQDTSRTNPVEYVHGVRYALGTGTEGRETTTLTEHDSMVELSTFLEKIVDRGGDFSSQQATSMLENLTFIGKPEYDEATKGISETWIKHLRDNPDAQICAVIGKIDTNMIKSDAYLLDNILKNFTDEQLEEFSGRLLLDPEAITADPENVRIIMLDDWTISGMQLSNASRYIISEYPQYQDQIEIQLIAATEQRVANGLKVATGGNSWSYKEVNVPVSAYFAAHSASSEYARRSEAHITGAHCAVDFDFNDEIARMASTANIDMPPATNIVRPYRKAGVKLTETGRLSVPSTRRSELNRREE